jgi:hypothetical protein
MAPSRFCIKRRFEKFGLEFRVFTRDLEAATPSGNPFEDIDHLIVRLDQLAPNEELQEKLCVFCRFLFLPDNWIRV